MKNFLFLFSFFLVSWSFSQPYKLAVGLKGGYPSLGGLNVKKTITSSTAVEFSIGGYAGGLNLSALFEIQKSLPEPAGMNWYLGAGPSVGSINGNIFLTANGVIGVDYTFEDFPLNLALDTGPVIGLIGANSFLTWGGGFAVRYALK